MMPPDGHDAARNARIAIEQGPLWGRRDRRRLLPHLEAGPSIQGIGGRGLNVPAHTKVESQPRDNSEIVLDKEPRAPIVRVAGHRCVLRDRRRQAHHEIRERWNSDTLARHGIVYVRAIEAKHAIIVQQSLLYVFIESFVASEGNRLPAAGIA